MDAPFRAGDLRHGYQAVADNLPERSAHPRGEGDQEDLLQELHGRARQRSHPAARAAHDATPAQARQGARREGYLAATLMHEICHGLGPAFARTNGKQVDIREAIGPAFSGLEEAKADVVGMFGAEVARGSRRAAEGAARGVLRVVRRRHLPHRALRHRRGARPRRDDGVQLPAGERRAVLTEPDADSVDYAKMPAALAALAKDPARDRGDRAIARGPRAGSPNTTKCRRS